MTLRRQLIVVFTAFALAIVALTLVPIGFLLEDAHADGYIAQRTRESRAVVASIRDRAVEEQGGILRARYPIGGPTSAVLVGPGGARLITVNPEAFPGQLGPEVGAASGGPDAHRLGSSPQGRRLFLALPVIHQARAPDVLWVSTSMRLVTELNRNTWLSLLGAGAAALIGSAALAAAIARRLTRRLERLAEAAARFGAGALDEPVGIEGSDEIADLARRLDDMAARIRALLDREREFVAAASHQIRTPLTAIQLRIDEIRSVAPVLSPDARTSLDEMAAEVQRLTTLSARLLDLSAGSWTRDEDPVEVGAAIADAVDRLRPLADRNAIRVVLEDDARGTFVTSPPEAFGEVVFNLVDNAVKYSPQGGVVRIAATTADGRVIVRVEDDGPGIPEAQRGRVLEPFYRASRAKQGYGLGLAICARLCDAVGATLRMESAPGGGTRAVVEWPRDERASRA